MQVVLRGRARECGNIVAAPSDGERGLPRFSGETVLTLRNGKNEKREK